MEESESTLCWFSESYKERCLHQGHNQHIGICASSGNITERRGNLIKIRNLIIALNRALSGIKSESICKLCSGVTKQGIVIHAGVTLTILLAAL